MNDYNGIFPNNEKALTSLPGIGKYTAAAILSFAYEKHTLAFDTNLQRVFGRFLHGNKNAQIDISNLETTLQSKPKTLNAAIMDFANIICTQKPLCDQCPLSSQCVYKQEKGENEITITKKKTSFPTKDSQVFLTLHKDHKEYYSENPDSYKVFQLPKETNTRSAIKEHFQKNYNLTLSVRPPNKKKFINNIPTLFINAQILLGNHEFGIFTKEEIDNSLSA